MFSLFFHLQLVFAARLTSFPKTLATVSHVWVS